MRSRGTTLILAVSSAVLPLGVLLYFGVQVLPVVIEVRQDSALPAGTEEEYLKDEIIVVEHLHTPEPLKGIYMTSFVAGDKTWRSALVSLIEETELNAVVIDIKDYTGRIAFSVEDPMLKAIGSETSRVSDIASFIRELHSKGIYVVGRVSVFQDPFLVLQRPDLAVKRQRDQTEVWKDYKGLSWLDPGAVEVWDYIAALGREAYALGFDEINFDYIRFPSDGDISDVFYPHSGNRSKSEVIREFFSYLSDTLKDQGVVLSIDLFGMTTINTDDLNIGQLLEDALPFFDYVSPMVYPSHYPPTFMGFKNPAEKPYEVVLYSLDRATERASGTAWKIRPWLQDFSLGATYTPEMVRKQVEAVYHAGLSSWMLWSAANRYSRAALLREVNQAR